MISAEANTTRQLGIVGNISRDHVVYADGQTYDFIGGAALHISLASYHTGVSADPISILGKDMAWIRHHSQLAAINFRTVSVLSGKTCSFEITYDKQFNVIKFEADFGVSADLTRHALRLVGNYRHVHVCCRRPMKISPELECAIAKVPGFSLDFHIASAAENIHRVIRLLPQASFIFVNYREFEMLNHAIRPEELKTVIVSNGMEAARLFVRGKLVHTVQPKPANVLEVTGAGDALTGTFLGHVIRGADLKTALQLAVDFASAWVGRLRLSVYDNQ